MDASMKCVKFLLFGFNLLFALSGLTLIITGGVIQGVYKEYLDFLGDQFFNTPVLLIVVGCIIFFVTFFGCCGAIKENHCMTVTFTILLVFIFLLEMGAGIAAYMLRSDVRGIIEINMERGQQNFNKEGFKGVTETWNIVQHELKCCGSQEYKDWKNTTFGTSGNVPDSCCHADIPGCGVGILNKSPSDAAKIINLGGCLVEFEALIIKNIAAVGGVGVGIGLIQFIGIIFSSCLARSIKRQYETV